MRNLLHLALLFFFVSPTLQAGLFQNGSFEFGFTGWTNSPNIVNNPFPGVIIPSDGTNCVEFGVNDVSGSILSQSFSITEGSDYVLSFDVLAQGNAGKVGVLRVNISSINNTLISRSFTNAAQTGPPFVFQSETVNFSVPSNLTNLTLTFTDISPDNGVAVDPVLDNVKIVANNAAPSITSHPTSKIVALGTDVSFLVEASGSEPLRYQWRFEGTEITGKTGSSLTLNNVQPADAGNYSVVITNTVGSVTSSNAFLSILVPVTVTLQPQGQIVPAGTNVAFNVSAAGSLPVAYQWKLDGTNIAGATNSTFEINNVQPTNSGMYSVRVSNPVSFAESSNAVLSVVVLPEITQQPQSIVAIMGTNVTFSVGTSGSLPNISSGTLRLWLKADAGVLADSNNRVNQWQDFSGNNSHCLQASAANQPVWVESALNGQPAIRFDGIQSASLGDFLQGNNNLGLTAGFTTFMVYSKGNGGGAEEVPAFVGVPGFFDSGRGYYLRFAEMSFSGWGNDYRSGFFVPALTSRVWTERMNPSKTQIEFFDTDGTNNFTTVRATSGLLSPGSGYYVGGLGTHTRNFQGDVAELIYFQGTLNESDRQSVEQYLRNKYFKTGWSAGLGYQWRFNGTNILGATKSFLTLTNVQPESAGNYSVTVTNLAGSVTSSNALLTIRVPAAIVVHPKSQSLPLGTNVTFTVSAIGDFPLNYQWKFKGTNIVGATASSYSISNVQATDAGNYSVTVSNSVNAVTSSNALLSILITPTILNQPHGLTALAGTNFSLGVFVQGSALELPQVASGSLQLWLKADAGVVADANNLVSEWQDQSGKTNHAFQPNPNKQPVWVTSAINGQPIIHFDGVQDANLGDFLHGSNTVDIPQGFTSFLVYLHSNRVIAEEVPVFVGIPGMHGAGRAYYLRTLPNPTNEMSFSAWGYDFGSGFSVPGSIPRIWTDRVNPAKTQIEFFDTDGTNDFTTIQAASGLSSIGAGYYVGGLGSLVRNFQGDIAEVIYYQGTLNELDRQSVEGYLRQKYLQSAVSAGVLGYQWQLNGTNVFGATNASIAFTNAQPVLSGNYTVVITNSVGAVTSTPALVKIRYIFPAGNGQRLTNSQYSYTNSLSVSFQSYFTNGTIFYTLDGSTPTFASEFYTGPFVLAQDATIRAIAYSSDFSQSGESDPVNISIVPTYSLSAATAGGGSVAINGAGPFLSNSVVNVTATASNGWTFLHWLGDASGTNTTTSVTMTRNKSVRAVFGTALNTTVAGNGSISVYPTNGLHPFGAVARLTATAQPGNYFGIWGNAASGNVNPLYFTVTNPNPTISSLFSTLSAGQFSLTLSASGSGRASASPRANAYNNSQLVTLTATPDAGQFFTGWSGDASGTGNPLNVTMNQSKSITANFTKNPRLAAQIELSTLALEGLQLVLTGEPGEIYSLQKSTNLTDWSTISTVTNVFGRSEVRDLPPTNLNHQFYRAMQP